MALPKRRDNVRIRERIYVCLPGMALGMSSAAPSTSVVLLVPFSHKAVWQSTFETDVA
jgi:hypothetical protein